MEGFIRRNAIRRFGFALVAATLLAGVGAPIAHAEEGFEPTRTSKILPGFTLPGTAERMVDAEKLEKLMEGVDQMGVKQGMERVKPELLGWDLENGKNDRETVKRQFVAALKGAGYSYEIIPGNYTLSVGKVVFFKSSNPSAAPLLGYWIEAPTGQILSWAKMARIGGSGGAGTKAGTPGELRGKWQMTQITATTYTDSYTGTYAGSGNQGAQIYEFLPGGRYKFYNYVKTRAYSSYAEAYTWEDGTVSMSGDRIILRPTGGKFKVVGSAASHNYDRPYTPKEIKERVRSLYWTVDGDTLKMGQSRNSPLTFKKTD